MIDTHCHLTDDAFANDRDAVVERMRAAGVDRALLVESDPARLPDTLSWTQKHPPLRIATACHPHDASKWTPPLRAALEAARNDPLVAAIGEFGLDYHYDFSPRDAQAQAFDEQLAIAVTRSVPVIIHARQADDDVAATLRRQPSATVVLHSFSSGPALRDAALACGWYLSFSGMVTFKSWSDIDAVRSVALDRLLIETDSPYLAPVPHRGKRNEPATVVHVAAKVAELRGTSVEEIARATTENAMRLFWTRRSDSSFAPTPLTPDS